MKIEKYRNYSILLYILALMLPMFIGAWLFLGLFGLLVGWMGLLEPIIGLPWLANVLYFINLYFKKWRLKIRILISIATIVFGLFAIGIRSVPRDEGGGITEVFVGFGFLIWMMSFVFLLISQIRENQN
ncbi:hypothetical protein DIS07_06425 [Polaribacter aquimarinus]|uniref:Uncharacterized protein n=2 Tax=Polaribacter aquimarinus TaxID=2100726 RepID=A0A2U2JCI9_9FLAO|nr:hypothetical protein DIS07_06425 [Polaribacter aquimarinus]